jgi:hypothetical protein
MDEAFRMIAVCKEMIKKHGPGPAGNGESHQGEPKAASAHQEARGHAASSSNNASASERVDNLRKSYKKIACGYQKDHKYKRFL